MSEFDEDTAVRPVGDGAWAATLTERWNALGGTPNGGYLLGVCLRALGGALPHPDPLVASATYLRRAAPGPALVTTEVLRAGRTVATGQARLEQDGRPVVHAVATYASLDTATGLTKELGAPPDLPAPEDCVDPVAGQSVPGVTIVERYETRHPRAPGWFQGRPSGDPAHTFWIRLSDGRDADLVSLAALVDAAAPVVLELGVAGSATLQLTVHLRARPAPGWLACRVTTRHVIGGFHEEDFEVWDSHGHLVAQSRQLALIP